MFLSDGKAAPCSSKVTTWHVSQQKPCVRGRGRRHSLFPQMFAPSGGDRLPTSASLGRAGPTLEPDSLRLSLMSPWGSEDQEDAMGFQQQASFVRPVGRPKAGPKYMQSLAQGQSYRRHLLNIYCC